MASDVGSWGRKEMLASWAAFVGVREMLKGSAAAEHEVAAVRVGVLQLARAVGEQDQVLARDAPVPRLRVVH